MTQVSGPSLKNRTHSPPYGKCDWSVCVTKWNCLIASFFAVCSIIPSSWSFQQQLGSILPAAAAAGGLADTRAFESMECGLFGFHTCVYVVFHTCVCCRPPLSSSLPWVGGVAQNPTLLNSRDLSSHSPSQSSLFLWTFILYRRIFPFFKTVYTILPKK